MIGWGIGRFKNGREELNLIIKKFEIDIIIFRVIMLFFVFCNICFM